MLYIEVIINIILLSISNKDGLFKLNILFYYKIYSNFTLLFNSLINFPYIYFILLGINYRLQRKFLFYFNILYIL